MLSADYTGKGTAQEREALEALPPPLKVAGSLVSWCVRTVIARESSRKSSQRNEREEAKQQGEKKRGHDRPKQLTQLQPGAHKQEDATYGQENRCGSPRHDFELEAAYLSLKGQMQVVPHLVKPKLHCLYIVQNS